MKTKARNKCSITKPIDEFYPDIAGRPKSECNLCENKRSSERRKRNTARLRDYTNEIQKRCCRCNIVQSSANFYKNRGTLDGFRYSCKTCDRARKTIAIHNRLETNKDKTRSDIRITHKHCTSCNQTKPTSEYQMDRSSKDYLARICQACWSLLSKKSKAKVKHKNEINPTTNITHKRCPSCNRSQS